MAALEFTSRRTRAAGVSDASRPPDLSTATRRPQSRRENAIETGKTLLILVLLGLGIVALQYVLVFVRGLLH
jgi:hypothetical protein